VRDCARSPRFPLRYRLLERWVRLKRKLGFGPPGFDPPWRGPDEPALVPAGGPRRPLPSSAIALELPREPDDTDARGFFA
jgi:hypothetical protein